MTNEEIREELKRVRSGRLLSSEVVAIFCNVIEALLDRDDPDVEVMIQNQRGTPDEEFERGGNAELPK